MEIVGKSSKIYSMYVTVIVAGSLQVPERGLHNGRLRIAANHEKSKVVPVTRLQRAQPWVELANQCKKPH